MSDSPSLQELIEVQRHFGLPNMALVEKDWYVVKALAAITSVDATPFRLVFGGGTALSRAHRFSRRMSEDIDLKIIADDNTPRSAFRQLRDEVTGALLKAGFSFNPDDPKQRESANASRYTLYHLPYLPITAGVGVLRPEIQIETAVWPLRRPAVERSVISFIAEAFKRPAEVPAISCVSIAETAAEKFVALTRRAGAEQAGAGGPRDPTLVRHIYDLHVIRREVDPADVIDLAQTIILADVEAYGHQFPAYRDNPVGETLRAVAGLREDLGYRRRYENFLRDMVYGETAEFAEALATVVGLAECLSLRK